MRLSTMANNALDEKKELDQTIETPETNEEVAQEENTETPETNEENTQTEEPEVRGAADIDEDELEHIKSLANPQETPDAETEKEEVDDDTQAELDLMKSIAGI